MKKRLGWMHTQCQYGVAYNPLLKVKGKNAPRPCFSAVLKISVTAAPTALASGALELSGLSAFWLLGFKPWLKIDMWWVRNSLHYQSDHYEMHCRRWYGKKSPWFKVDLSSAANCLLWGNFKKLIFFLRLQCFIFKGSPFVCIRQGLVQAS